VGVIFKLRLKSVGVSVMIGCECGGWNAAH
jgi:hypothetical protein